MREYILTEKEKDIIIKFLATGEKPKGFPMLLSRCRHMQPIQEDQQLIDQFLKKAAK